MAKTNQGRGRSSRGRGSVSRGGGGQRGRGSQRGGCKFFEGKLKQGHPSHQQRKKHQQDNEKQPQRAQPQRDNKKPPPLPNFRGPTDRFVEGSDPQFAEIVSKCYGGFCVEGPETFDTKVSYAAIAHNHYDAYTYSSTSTRGSSRNTRNTSNTGATQRTALLVSLYRSHSSIHVCRRTDLVTTTYKEQRTRYDTIHYSCGQWHSHSLAVGDL